MICALATRVGKNEWWPKNFGATYAWMNSLFDVGQWRALHPDGLHPLFSLGHLSHFDVEPDELHILHLGVSMYALGSVLWLLCYKIYKGTPSENMTELWSGIAELYSTMRTSSQFTNLKLNSFTDPANPGKHNPKLKGKGSEVKG